MRYKSLPLSARHPRADRANGRPAPPPRPRHRIADWAATIPIIFLLPALVLVSGSVQAAGPRLSVPDVARAGATIEVIGTGHRPGAHVQLLFDGQAAGATTLAVDSSGRFSGALIVPTSTTPDRHQVASTYVDDRKKDGTGTRVVARTTITVTADASKSTSGSSSPSASASVNAPQSSASTAPSGTAAPTSTPELLATTKPIASAVTSPTAAPTASAAPLPTQGSSAPATPAPTPVATPVPVAAATPAPVLPAPTPAPVTAGCTVVVPAGGGVAAAMQSAAPGQTICLRGGMYAQSFSIDPPNGTPAARITLTSYPGERAVIAGLVGLTGIDYWTISNVSFTWNGGSYDQHMVKVMGGVGWVMSGVEMSGARSFANLLVAGAPQGWTIRNSVFRDTYGGEADGNRSHNLYVNAPNSTGGLIEGNVFSNAPKGYNVKLSGSTAGTDGTDNVVFRGNTLAGANRANLALGNAADNNVIEGNVFSGSGDAWAVRLWDLRGVGNVVRNNRFSQPAICNDYDSTVKCAQVVGPGNTH